MTLPISLPRYRFDYPQHRRLLRAAPRRPRHSARLGEGAPRPLRVRAAREPRPEPHVPDGPAVPARRQEPKNPA